MLGKSSHILRRIVIILALISLHITSSTAESIHLNQYVNNSNQYIRPELNQISPEIIDLFGDGLTEPEFLAITNGNLPKHLKMDEAGYVKVILAMDQPSLADVYISSQTTSGVLSAELQTDYLKSLDQVQEAVAIEVMSLGGEIIDRYTKAYNGMLVRLPKNQLQRIRSISGVKDVYPAPIHKPALENSVPLIRADEVGNDLGYDGNGITIAIIDTGIDYTHAAFGGIGDPGEYENNDPDIVEPDSFPTEKVIGGYDFAGSDYDADDPEHDIPVPDDDPLDGDGHGTHVASIAAGFEVPDSVGAGVAPETKLYTLKVFGEPAGSTDLTISAIEWAMDPNGDGDLSDHVDVINMSLGSDFGPASDRDPVIVASNNASKIGIVVVAAAGNGGDTRYITGSPGSANSVISVAASTTGYINGPTIEVPGTSIMTNTQIIYEPSSFVSGGHFTETLTAQLSYVGELEGVSDDELCSTDGLAAGGLDGKLAIIQRGSCGFSDKVNNAASLGAVGAILFNHQDGGNSLLVMSGDVVNIPAGFIGHEDGLSLLMDSGETASVSVEDELSTIENRYINADVVADFSARGPRGYDSILKPDITAPGVSIKAAKMGSGTEGVAYDGTSMASPHVAGVAALVKEAHPDWNPEQVKAAMINTAKYPDDDIQNVEIPRQSAGRIDAYKAVTSEVFVTGDSNLISLNWGVIPMQNNAYVDSKTITLQNISTSAKVFDVAWEFAVNSYTAGFSMTLPVTVEVKGSPGFDYVPVELTIDSTKVPSELYDLEEYYGFVTFTNAADSQEVLRVPFYAVPQPYSELMLTGSSLSGLYGTVDIEHSGPISSSLDAYPLYVMDANEPAQEDEADIRYVGMDYTGDFGSGPIFSLAIDVYGAWHTPQNLFSEFVLYLDVDQDPYGVWDYQVFNWNSGAASGIGDNDEWVIIKRNLATNVYQIGSSYTIKSDFNSGYMEWWLPANLYELDPSVDTDFIFKLVGYDDIFFGASNTDETELIYFDYSRPPFYWSFSNNPGPAINKATTTFWVQSSSGYIDSDPLGLMIVDYRGVPGIKQAYAHTFQIDKPYNTMLPLILRQILD